MPHRAIIGLTGSGKTFLAMTPHPEHSTPEGFIVIRQSWVDAFQFGFRAVLRWLYTLAVFGGCTYIVFWRGESGWLYLPACLLLIFRRGL